MLHKVTGPDKPSEAEIMIQGQLQIEQQKAQAQLQQEQLRSQNDVIIVF